MLLRYTALSAARGRGKGSAASSNHAFPSLLMGYRAGQSLSSGSLSVFPYLTGRAQFRDKTELRIAWGPPAQLPCAHG